MGILDSLKHPLPYVMESLPLPCANNGTNLPEYRTKPYFIVASIEMGNTTTKCILTGTDLETGATYIINKTVMYTRDARLPKEGEEVIAASLVGHPVSGEAVAELACEVLNRCHEEAGLSIEDDLDFVVRSTGMAASWHSPQQVAGFIGAIATGCVQAGVSPRKMTPPMSKEHLPRKLQAFSLMDKVTLRETVAGVIPPSDLAGADRLAANEMEGVLAMAGIKEGALLSPIDFRNPCIAMDFGTTVDGCITGDVPHDHEIPFARTIGGICGLGGAVPDALARGTPDVNDDNGTALDLLGDEFVATVLTPREHSVVREYTDQVHDLLEIRVIPDGVTTFGTVPVDPKGAAEQGILLIGCDCGTNFSDAHKLKEIGADLYENHGVKRMAEVIDHVCARMALRFIDVALEEKLLIPEKTAIGFSGRAATSGKKPEYIYHGIRDRNLYAHQYEHVIFVEDALARGASLMARCMCSLGRPQNPIGGCRGGPCILGRRRKVER